MASLSDTTPKSRLDNQLSDCRDKLLSQLQACQSAVLSEQHVSTASIEQLVDVLEQLQSENFYDLLNELKCLEAAFSALELGQYGICADCEEEILQEQLEQRPCCQRCASCQEKYLQRSSRDPRFYI